MYLGPRPLGPIRPQRRPSTPPSSQGQGQGFAAALEQALAPVNFSAHASQRLDQARRQLTPAELARVAAGLDRVAAKGGKETLMLLGDLALVVSVPNRTVITAVEQGRMKDHVFTNIDSAVVV